MKKLYLMMIICLFPLLMSGQALKTGYFSEFSTFRNKMNPAFAPRSGYVGFAALDNLGIGVNSNIGMTTLLYPAPDGSLQTFLHPDISAETFLKQLPANPYLDMDFDTDILNIGFMSGKNSYWTVSLGLKFDAEVNVPGELFKFLKLGAANNPQEYHIRDFNITQNAYAEIAVGYRHDFENLVPGLSVGGRLKFLAAADRIDARFNSIDMTMGTDKWNVKTDATVNAMVQGLDLSLDQEKGFNYAFAGPFGPAGYGGAIDLGAEYRLKMPSFFESIRFSAALLDLGFISYAPTAIQQFVSAGEFTYEGVKDLDPTDQNGMEDAMQQIQDELMGLANLEEKEVKEGKTARLKPQLLLGVEMPFLWNKMSFGVLYNAKFGYAKTRNELTLALSGRPAKSFNVGISYSMMNTAKTLGWLLEFIPRAGINMYLGSDYTFFNVNPQFIPVDPINFNLRLGFSIAFGSKFDKSDNKIRRR